MNITIPPPESVDLITGANQRTFNSTRSLPSSEERSSQFQVAKKKLRNDPQHSQSQNSNAQYIVHHITYRNPHPPLIAKRCEAKGLTYLSGEKTFKKICFSDELKRRY
ncbi:unnamed protein product [Rhizophagus irregularis]|nr:unnamed protein product [Rhizophagus irregularis]CAB4404536.1 unnamed protein product [Rhizophagus irregularis]